MSGCGDVGQNSQFFQVKNGPRILRSLPGAVHTWKSGHHFHGPLKSGNRVRLRWQLKEFLHFLRERGACSSCAVPGSTADTCSALVWVLLYLFSTCTWYSDPEVDFVLFSGGGGRARRRQQQWYVLCWCCWLRYASCCVPFDCGLACGKELCAQSMLQLRYLPELDTTFMSRRI